MFKDFLGAAVFKFPGQREYLSLCGDIVVPRASVSFGHVVGETEGSGGSHYRIPVNHGHPVTRASVILASRSVHAQKLILREGRDILVPRGERKRVYSSV